MVNFTKIIVKVADLKYETKIDHVDGINLEKASMVIISFLNEDKMCGQIRKSKSSMEATLIPNDHENDDSIKSEYKAIQHGPYAPLRFHPHLEIPIPENHWHYENGMTLYGKDSIIDTLNLNIEVNAGAKFPRQAVVKIFGSAEKISGSLKIRQNNLLPIFKIEGSLQGLEDGEFHVQIHENADCELIGKPLALAYAKNDNENHFGIIEPSANHAAKVGITLESKNVTYSLDPLGSRWNANYSVIGKALVIHAKNENETYNDDTKVTCGIIQAPEEFKKVITANAIFNHEKLKGELKFVQEGPGDLVHVQGTIFVNHPGSYGLDLSAFRLDECQKFSETQTTFEFEAFDENDVIAIENSFAKSLLGDFSILGGTAIIFAKDENATFCSDKIEVTKDKIPEICQLPSFELGKKNSCPDAGLAWTYDMKINDCILDQLEGCPYATENKFASEKECQSACPVLKPESKQTMIQIIPTDLKLAEFIKRKDFNSYTKQKLLLCHTIGN